MSHSDYPRAEQQRFVLGLVCAAGVFGAGCGTEAPAGAVKSDLTLTTSLGWSF